MFRLILDITWQLDPLWIGIARPRLFSHLQELIPCLWHAASIRTSPHDELQALLELPVEVEHPLSGCEHQGKLFGWDQPGRPIGLAFDAGHHRLFAATANRRLVVLNSDTGQFLAALPIGWGVDNAAYDSELRRVSTLPPYGRRSKRFQTEWHSGRPCSRLPVLRWLPTRREIAS